MIAWLRSVDWNKMIPIIAGFVILSTIVLGIVAGKKLEKELKINGIVVKTTILSVSCSMDAKQSIYNCRFMYNGQLTNIETISFFRDNAYQLVGTTITGIYSEKYDRLKLILDRGDSLKFGLAK
ncbi:MAG: hypothetical protein EOO03_05075 [Chitinophagaceae bacterium]|nr:MAG: hypothetical protein EOO03_05075 [Chitinophagaceae bacterium]